MANKFLGRLQDAIRRTERMCFVGSLVTVLTTSTVLMTSAVTLSQETSVPPAPDQAATAQVLTTEQTPAAEPAGLIDFNRDVRPIFESNCIECHGPKDAKEGFRVDEKETVMAYIEPGDLTASSLWSDYLVTSDEEMKMPPVAHNKPLTGAQLATIKCWIEEGAKWAEPAVVAQVPVAVGATSKMQRVTRLLGLFHPAAVHFPVALLLISTFFVICSFVYREAFEGAAFHCLWIGALSACASSALGWFFAESQGYGSVPSFDFNSAIERHRWTAIVVSTLSIAMIPIAFAARRQPEKRSRRIVWLVGASLLSILVSIAGHQGGELVFGEDLYTPAFNAIFDTPAK